MAHCAPRTPRRLVALATFLLGVGVLWVVPMPASATPPTASFAWGPCPEQVPAAALERVRCGVLTVPESRAAGTASQPTVDLAVAVVASRSATPQPDPVVHPTMGGPGASSFDGLWMFLEDDWATGARDGILIEQRGGDAAEPTLRCPELDPEHFHVDGRRLRRAERDAASDAAVRACHDRLVAQGIDLSTYTSAESAADLADLRGALGYDAWNLYGLSYGSRLALTVMRDQPAGLRSVILDGVYPPHVNSYELIATGFAEAVAAMAAACASDAACRARYPNVEEQLVELLEQTRQEPIGVSLTAPWDGDPVWLEIDDADIAGGLFQALYDDYQTRALPFVIDQLARGNTGVLVPLAQQSLDSDNRLAAGLMWSVNCTEELPFYQAVPPTVTDGVAAHLVESRTRDSCSLWPVHPRPASENEPVRSDVPTLLLNGGRDPITPPSFGRLAAQGLSRHVYVEFPSMGHGAVWHVWSDRCPASLAQQFLDDPTRPPDTACIAAMPGVRFLTTADVHPTPAIYRLNSAVIQPRDLGRLGPLAASTMASGAALGYALVGLLRRNRKLPRWGALAAAVASASTVAYVAGLAAVLLRTDPLVLAFGVPTAARPALVAGGLVSLTAAAALLLAVGRSWRRREGTLVHRITLTAAAAASATTVGWLLAHGLLFW